MVKIMIIHMEMKHDIEYFKNFLGIMGDVVALNKYGYLIQHCLPEF